MEGWKSLSQRIDELEDEIKWRQVAIDKQKEILAQLKRMRERQEAKS